MSDERRGTPTLHSLHGVPLAINAGDAMALLSLRPLKDNMHQNAMVLEARNVAQSQNAVPWLEIDRDTFKAKVAALPKRENVQTPPITEQLIVELYSK